MIEIEITFDRTKKRPCTIWALATASFHIFYCYHIQTAVMCTFKVKFLKAYVISFGPLQGNQITAVTTLFFMAYFITLLGGTFECVIQTLVLGALNKNIDMY